MKYNTSKSRLLYPEYGRHVQEMVDSIVEVEDKDKRTRMAHVIISMMKQLSNANDESEKRKLWDHLIIMSDYKLDVDCPFEKPKPGEKAKPTRMAYKKSQTRTKAFGSIIEDILRKLPEVEESKRAVLINRLANLMKNKYVSYNQESVTDEIIINTIRKYIRDIDFDVNQIELISLKDLEKSKKNKNKNGKK
jgi:hypothetical protein